MKKKINITVDDTLLEQVDKMAEQMYISVRPDKCESSRLHAEEHGHINDASINGGLSERISS